MHNSKQDEHSKNKTLLSNAACTNRGREIETTVEYLCGWDNTTVSTGGSWLSQEDKQTARPELTYWLKKYLKLNLFNGEISSDLFFSQKMSPAKLLRQYSFIYVECSCARLQSCHRSVRRKTANALKRLFSSKQLKHRIAKFQSIRSKLLNQVSSDLGAAIVGLFGSDHAVDPPAHANQVPVFTHQEHCRKTNLPFSPFEVAACLQRHSEDHMGTSACLRLILDHLLLSAAWTICVCSVDISAKSVECYNKGLARNSPNPIRLSWRAFQIKWLKYSQNKGH